MTGSMDRARALLERRLGDRPRVLVVLGSGLGPMAESVRSPVEVPFGDLPGFPPSGVAGHAGRFVGGLLDGVPVLLQSGRYHFYEGHPAEVIVRPVRLAEALGVGTVILTNAAGSLNPAHPPGSVVLLERMLDLQNRALSVGSRPTRPDPWRGEVTTPFDPGLGAAALAEAVAQDVPLGAGCYAGVLGPSYETPAEIRMLRVLGADVVGMSTVAEARAASSLGLRLLGLSVVTNWAAGVRPEPLSHDDVLAVGRTAGPRLEAVVRGVLRRELADPAGPERSRGREVDSS